MSSCHFVPGRGIHRWRSDTLPQFHSHSFPESRKPCGFFSQSQRGEVPALRYLVTRQIGLLKPLFYFIQIILDNKDLESHATTTNEIKECCRDIRVLGRKELRLVV